MNDTPGNGLVVRTARLAESDVWIWEIVDAASGRVVERSSPSPGAGYDARELAQQAGATRLGARHGGRSVLILLPRSRVDLYQALKRSFADGANADVVLDRRFRDRRARVAPHERERRTQDRRRRTDVDAQLHAGRFVTIPIFARTVNFLDPDARALLLLCCSPHVVGCQKCQNTFRLGWLPRADSGLFACPLCGFDMTPAVGVHTETCPYWSRHLRRPQAIEE